VKEKFLEKENHINNHNNNNNNNNNNRNTQENNPPINKGNIKKFNIKKCKRKYYLNTKELIAHKDILQIEPKSKELTPQWKTLKDDKQWVIGTLNCHGLTKIGEIDTLALDLKEMKADIFIITETWEKKNNVNF
jgi:hypothetical protein